MYYGTTIRIMTDFLSEITKKEDNGTASLSAKRERENCQPLILHPVRSYLLFFRQIRTVIILLWQS